MITEERLKEIEKTLEDSGKETWRFPGWKEDVIEEEDLRTGIVYYKHRYCFIPELDELEPTGIQNSNTYVDWQVWEFIIKSHNEFVPELIAEVRSLKDDIKHLLGKLSRCEESRDVMDSYR